MSSSIDLTPCFDLRDDALALRQTISNSTMAKLEANPLAFMRSIYATSWMSILIESNKKLQAKTDFGQRTVRLIMESPISLNQAGIDSALMACKSAEPRFLRATGVDTNNNANMSNHMSPIFIENYPDGQITGVLKPWRAGEPSVIDTTTSEYSGVIFGFPNRKKIDNLRTAHGKLYPSTPLIIPYDKLREAFGEMRPIRLSTLSLGTPLLQLLSSCGKHVSQMPDINAHIDKTLNQYDRSELRRLGEKAMSSIN